MRSTSEPRFRFVFSAYQRLSDTNDQEYYTIEHFVAALEATTTLTELEVDFGVFLPFMPTPANNRRIIEPLCRCIANLRFHNENHLLRKLVFFGANLDGNERMHAVFQQFLIAAKQFGIGHVKFHDVVALPVRSLVELCRDNNNNKVLEIDCVLFLDGTLMPPMDRSQESSVILTLIIFKNSTAATEFANFVAQLNVLALELGEIHDCTEGGEHKADGITRIVSEFMPTVEHLTLEESCYMEHFETALTTGMATVAALKAGIIWDVDEDDDTAAKLESLTDMIRGAVKLNSLTIIDSVGFGRLRPPPPFFQALEACASLTEIRVEIDANPREFALLQHITARNCELEQFVASPSTYPTEKLLTLMLHFDNCPTGRYVLCCRLPEIFR